ncbi:(2Fe-2S)-binding protein [Rhodoplanes sp. TEM]|uniref:(2Fe-2S)-binding protein n=1 Tax=Rhodoplanes tepidamans TaxID=200616 RepID=A0ABT5J7I1_RHOTP|nr:MULTISPECIES: (2Fe-2S)-binding protein [Rhodoplanes]MDC7785604.1 (2Fe-2S)-binding protein [Rhodoplanes tepidamans]MDC7985705.1 (2Fe-2S)-binding protein [Rhodoplanes sp. TEM]MDQ0354830.1 aerobic-type carbon monoxide dehydrogenase small subunit (CoxS/CutS family) [Rhodoplanes tepidamans]
MKVSFTLNGEAITADVEPRTSLADLVRGEHRCTSVHLGCEHGVCGACTVLIDGKIARSCITLAVALDGTAVTTLEGFEGDALMDRLREAFRAHHGLQCGYCTPGMLITAHDLIRRKGALSEAALRQGLAGNICRCTGYAGIVAAVAAAMDEHGDTARAAAIAAE